LEEFTKIADLNPSSRSVNAKFHVIEKSETREVTSRKDGSTYRICEALVGDPSGCILMSVWEDDIKWINEGENYKLTNGYINVFKNSMRLNIGRKGQIEKISEDIEANTDNNVSEKKVESRFKPRRYGKKSGRY
jgi:replication factor A1